MTQQRLITLNDGKLMPQVGLGVWQTPADEAERAVGTALAAGYRHIDTAAVYENEREVGAGIAASGVPRGEIFLTTKLWNDDQGFDSALRAFDQSLARLGTDYVDLYLIHWPAPSKNLYAESWKALLRLKEEGRARSIGVSNFGPAQIRRLIDETGVTPVLNQIELHPRFQQKENRAFHASLGIATESWSPLGQGTLLNDPVIGGIAARHGKTPAQVIIRWHIENGLIVIPKSVTPSRIISNFDVFGFTLAEDDMAAIGALDDEGGRTGPDPMTATF